MNLNELRKEIDVIDNEILNLIAKRMNLSKDIAKLKINDNLGVLNSERENEIINSRFEYFKNLGYDDSNFINAFFGIILIKSKQIQNQLIDTK